MITSNIYLTFNGNCEEAFNYYKSILGGEFPYIEEKICHLNILCKR
jgi:PhnB protein